MGRNRREIGNAAGAARWERHRQEPECGGARIGRKDGTPSWRQNCHTFYEGKEVTPPEDPTRQSAGVGKKPKPDKSKLIDGAAKLLDKDKCDKFVVGALQKGFLDVNQVGNAAQLGEVERGIYNGLSTGSVVNALKNATIEGGGKAPTTTQGGVK